MEIREVNPGCASIWREIMLRIYGVPLGAWSYDNIFKIGSVFGKVLSVDYSSYGCAKTTVITDCMFFVNCKLILDIEEKSHLICISGESQPRYDREGNGVCLRSHQSDISSDEDNGAWSTPLQKKSDDLPPSPPLIPQDPIITSTTVSSNNEPPFNSPPSQEMATKEIIISPQNKLANSAKNSLSPHPRNEKSSPPLKIQLQAQCKIHLFPLLQYPTDMGPFPDQKNHPHYHHYLLGPCSPQDSKKKFLSLLKTNMLKNEQKKSFSMPKKIPSTTKNLSLPFQFLALHLYLVRPQMKLMQKM